MFKRRRKSIVQAVADETIAAQREARLQRNADNAAIASANAAARARGEKASAYWDSLGKAGSDIFDDAFPDIGKTTTGPVDRSKPPGQAGATSRVKPPTYRVAFRRVMSGLRSQYAKPNGQWKFGFTNKQMKAKVNQVLRSKGIRPKKKVRGRPGAPGLRRPGAPGIR